MRFLLNREKSRSAPREPVMAEVPELHAAQLAAAYYGERQGGDLHDFVRVTPNRVLFGLLDMAGRLEENSAIVSAAQQTFRTRSQELFAVEDVNAGHTPGLLRDLSGITELSATGLPLGLFSHATCEAPLVALPPGAALLLVSRGLLEGRRRREEFGLERVKSGLQQAADETAEELCASTIEGVQQFMRKPPIHNDVTALALVRTVNSRASSGGQN